MWRERLEEGELIPILQRKVDNKARDNKINGFGETVVVFIMAMLSPIHDAIVVRDRLTGPGHYGC